MEVGSSISSMLLAFVQTVTGLAPANPVGTSLSMGNMLLNAVLVGIAFPILEELVFRKLLCSRLLPLGEKKAIVISAAIFGLIHGNLYQFAYAFLLGLVFGYVYVKTGKLIYTIIFHCIINLYSGVFAQFVISKVPIDEITELLTSENILADPNLFMEQLSPYASEIALYMAFAYIMLGLSLAGFIVLLVITVKRKITFEQGILQTPSEHRFSNFFLNSGIAAAIGFIAVSFFLSIFE
jgi:membrane protease YdiL (CAAX protease family)